MWGCLVPQCRLLTLDTCSQEFNPSAQCNIINAPVSPIEWVVLIFVLGHLAFLGDYFVRVGYQWRGLFAYSANTTDAIGVVLQLTAYGMRFYGSSAEWTSPTMNATITTPDGSDEDGYIICFRVIRTVVAVLTWFRYLSFAETAPSIGPLIMSVRRMFFDVRNFVALAGATVMGFSFAVYALLSYEERVYVQNGGDLADDSGPRITTIFEIIVFSIYSMMGLLDADYSAFQPLGSVKYTMFVILFALYGITAAVLLINLLIA